MSGFRGHGLGFRVLSLGISGFQFGVCGIEALEFRVQVL